MPESVSNNAVCEGFVNGVPYVYSFGGIDSSLSQGGIHLKSWRYNTQSKVWEVLPDLPDSAGKIAAAASRIGDIIYIIGGYSVALNGNETSSAKVHRFDTQSNTFISDATPITIAIDDHVQVVYRDSLIYVITGWSNTSNVPLVQIYNPTNDTWQLGTTLANNNLYKVFGAAGTIIGDTIYYYGGASMGTNFPATFQIRKGIINASDPTLIQWSVDTLEEGLNGYRMAATSIHDTLYWIGGSSVSYNYDAIAYNGSGVVSPNNHIIQSTGSLAYQIDSSFNLPMDLRGVAKISENEFYLVGGIGPNGIQSNKTLKFTWNKSMPVAIQEKELFEWNAFPIPITDQLNIKDLSLESLPYEIINIEGAKMANGIIKNQVIDLSNLSAGTYFLLVQKGPQLLRKKLLKL